MAHKSINGQPVIGKNYIQRGRFNTYGCPVWESGLDNEVELLSLDYDNRYTHMWWAEIKMVSSPSQLARIGEKHYVPINELYEVD